MALIVTDTLADYLGERTLNHRFDIWLYHYLKQQPGSQIQQAIGGTSNMRGALAEELKRLGIAATTVVESRKTMLLPAAEFDWFEDSKRFFMWLLAQSEQLPPNAHTELRYYGSRQLSYREACIAHTDTANNPLQEKLLKLSDYKLRWQNRLHAGKEFVWVSGENEEEKVRLALKEIKAIAFEVAPLFLSNPETHEDLLIFINEHDLSLKQAKAASKEARTKYSQLKYRSNKNKSQLNVHIATKATERLVAIAEKHHLSKAKVIEYLINAEFEKGLYISEKMAAWLRGDAE